MKILSFLGDTNKTPPRIVLVFGSGLVGCQVLKALESYAPVKECHVQYSWQCDDDISRRQLSVLTDLLNEHLAFFPIDPAPSVSIVWAAGKTGFDSAEEAVEWEMRDFKRIISFAEQSAAENGGPHRFFMLASAGALFEGQRLILKNSIPSPRRPYGFLKREQECLLARAEISGKFVYRLSSVYGPFTEGNRINLISAMLTAGLRRQVCRIFGNLGTLRDYVDSRDIGLFVAGEIMSALPQASDRPLILASYKPTTIFEMRKIIEDSLRRKLYVSFDPVPSNALDITYAPSCAPSHFWNPTTLYLGIRSIMRSSTITGNN